MRKLIFLSSILALLLSACGRQYRSEEINKTVFGEPGSKKVRADAYLFDAKLKRNNKPTSLRLELFRTDTLLAFNGRAYLGKGAIKGRITHDSIIVYFPTTNEYLYESLSDLSGLESCDIPLDQIKLLSIVSQLPDSLSLPEYQISTTKKDRKSYSLDRDSCWQVDLEYDLRKGEWQLRKFSLSNLKNITISAKRREFRRSVKIKPEVFRLVVPADAVRMSP